MPWALLLDLRVLLGIALIGMALYAKVQNLGWQHCQAEYAQFQADVESEAAKAKVAAARESLRRSENAQEVLSALQTRYAALDARYRVLRSSAGSGPVPALPDAAPSAPTITTGQPDAASRPVPQESCLAALEAGDRELAKYRQLWNLQLKNSGSAI